VCLIVCSRATRISARPSGSVGTGWRVEDDESGPRAWRDVRIEVMDFVKPVGQPVHAWATFSTHFFRAMELYGQFRLNNR
jgi:hypothetical protein